MPDNDEKNERRFIVVFQNNQSQSCQITSMLGNLSGQMNQNQTPDSAISVNLNDRFINVFKDALDVNEVTSAVVKKNIIAQKTFVATVPCINNPILNEDLAQRVSENNDVIVNLQNSASEKVIPPPNPLADMANAIMKTQDIDPDGRAPVGETKSMWLFENEQYNYQNYALENSQTTISISETIIIPPCPNPLADMSNTIMKRWGVDPNGGDQSWKVPHWQSTEEGKGYYYFTGKPGESGGGVAPEGEAKEVWFLGKGQTWKDF